MFRSRDALPPLWLPFDHGGLNHSHRSAKHEQGIQVFVLQQEWKVKSSSKVTIANNPKKGAFPNII